MTDSNPPKTKRLKTGGRKKGSLNKKTIELRAAARGYGQVALNTLVKLVKQGSSEAIRFQAAQALLDRGYGRAPQAIEHTGKDGQTLESVSNMELARRVAYLLTSGIEEKPGEEDKEGGVGPRDTELRGEGKTH
ncbi:MAG: hypothetical protein ACR2PH_07580 [Desulfobulbia bacterium]